MRERIVRGTDTAIVTIERRRRQYANVMTSLSQERDRATCGRGESVPTRVEIVNDEQDFEPGG